MEEYAKNKLSAKLNLILSQGKKSEGVLTDASIDYLMMGFEGDGTYEIVWDQRKLFPTAIQKLDERYEFAKSGTNYIATFEGKFQMTLFWSQIIKFDAQERRNILLKELLR